MMKMNTPTTVTLTVGFLVAVGIVIFALTVIGNSTLSKAEYSDAVRDLGFTITNVDSAYDAAVTMCRNNTGDEEIRTLTRIATMNTPKTNEQIEGYLKIVRSTC